MVEKYGLYDIYGITYVPWWQTKTCMVIIISVACIVIVALIVMLYRRYKSNHIILKPCWDIALEQLALCKTRSHNFSDESGKELYSMLTDIIKKYLQARFGYDLQGKTDNEILIYLASVKFPAELQEQVSTIFKNGAEIKFAHGRAMREQFEHYIILGTDIVKRTIEQLPPQS